MEKTQNQTNSNIKPVQSSAMRWQIDQDLKALASPKTIQAFRTEFTSNPEGFEDPEPLFRIQAYFRTQNSGHLTLGRIAAFCTLSLPEGSYIDVARVLAPYQACFVGVTGARVVGDIAPIDPSDQGGAPVPPNPAPPPKLPKPPKPSGAKSSGSLAGVFGQDSEIAAPVRALQDKGLKIDLLGFDILPPGQRGPNSAQEQGDVSNSNASKRAYEDRLTPLVEYLTEELGLQMADIHLSFTGHIRGDIPAEKYFPQMIVNLPTLDRQIVLRNATRSAMFIARTIQDSRFYANHTFDVATLHPHIEYMRHSKNWLARMGDIITGEDVPEADKHVDMEALLAAHEARKARIAAQRAWRETMTPESLIAKIEEHIQSADLYDGIVHSLLPSEKTSEEWRSINSEILRSSDWSYKNLPDFIAQHPELAEVAQARALGRFMLDLGETAQAYAAENRFRPKRGTVFEAGPLAGKISGVTLDFRFRNDWQGVQSVTGIPSLSKYFDLWNLPKAPAGTLTAKLKREVTAAPDAAAPAPDEP